PMRHALARDETLTERCAKMTVRVTGRYYAPHHARTAKRGPFDHRRVLHPALAAVGFLADVLPAPVRRPSHVHDVEGLGAVLLPAHLRDPGLELPGAARLRDLAPHAPRLQRHPARSAFAAQLQERVRDDVGHQASLRRF